MRMNTGVVSGHVNDLRNDTYAGLDGSQVVYDSGREQWAPSSQQCLFRRSDGTANGATGPGASRSPPPYFFYFFFVLLSVLHLPLLFLLVPIPVVTLSH